MNADLLEQLADKYALERQDIGRPGEGVYLTRWTLWGKRSEGDFALFLHCFHRSDHDDALHDHPWPYISYILAGGYFEFTQGKGSRYVWPTWYGPGSLLNRPADHKHRVELVPGQKCWTLVLRGKKERAWGFHCWDKGTRMLTGKFVPWASFVDRLEAGALGCG